MFKDIFPRYKTMCGFYVERKGGWDCHGLPVELAVEAELGMTSKEDIERYGIAEFNARCREMVLSHVEDWNRLTERIGFWIDLDDAYRTLDTDYIESVWWALKTIHDKGLLYEKLKVVPYCPRCGTALSSHELGQPDVYRDVHDPTVYVRFPVVGDGSGTQPGDELLVWTTTPWTLVSNAAVAVDPELPYVRARTSAGRLHPGRGADRARARRRGVEILETVPRQRARGRPLRAAVRLHSRQRVRAEGPHGAARRLRHRQRRHRPRAHRDRVRRGRLPARRAVRAERRQPGPARRHLRRADRAVRRPLGQGRRSATWSRICGTRGRLLRAESYEHSYPHCWRCDTPLLYYAKPSWYIGTSQIKDRLLAANEDVNWHPEHVKHGRFGKWLEGNVDWALSRERYWGTPLPVWRCESNASTSQAIGSFARAAQSSRARS